MNREPSAEARAWIDEHWPEYVDDVSVTPYPAIDPADPPYWIPKPEGMRDLNAGYGRKEVAIEHGARYLAEAHLPSELRR